MQRQQLYDGAAIAASGLCLIHCLLLPTLLLFLPALSAFLAVPESFHRWALAFAVPTSALALGAGFLRHRHARPALIVLPGVLLLTSGALWAPTERMETLLSIVGALLLAIGHALNWRALTCAVV